MNKKTNGFGLIEIILLIATISVLVSTALPALKHRSERIQFRELVDIATPITAAIDKCLGFERDAKSCDSLDKIQRYGFSATAVKISSLVDSVALTLKIDQYILTLTPPEENKSSPFILASHTYIKVADIIDRNGRPVIESWMTAPKSGCMVAGLCH